MADIDISIEPFCWQYWNALWKLRAFQLSEIGIRLHILPGRPDLDSPYEQDYHRIDQVYQSGAGNFWLAWAGQTPVGHIGAQAFGDAVELRRMYVRPDYRRLRVGTRLVQTLIDHCVTRRVGAIELWAAEHGAGRCLYEKLGFQVVREPGREFKMVTPPEDEIRMRLELNGFRPYEEG